jgi:hypothetical protein
MRQPTLTNGCPLTAKIPKPPGPKGFLVATGISEGQVQGVAAAEHLAVAAAHS